ncbi:dicarboxylate transporter/tellurite-resistance protein TehA [Dyella humicola]|uniref:dicarboxylate transporter/tellurite-resistance protein TehA n=1 Tax=Dyella humicola TaxID=2992126 RepID=UPI002255A795|nr:dicarboxylate transporter/tellurite-resistance protein TehA [Dyella humicola]
MGSLKAIPASFFGTVLGIIGLGGSWRMAGRLWQLPHAIGEAIMLFGALVWALLVALYVVKWVWSRDRALAEARDAVQCCFIGLAPATFALMALAIGPYHHGVAIGLWIVGSAGQLAFGLFRSGGMWRGGRDLATVTPILFLPTVAGNFICAIAAGTLGQPSWGVLFFGAGFFNWVVMESVILFRLWMGAPINEPLRPAVGIQLAPPVVGSLAYLANTQGLPDLFAQAMWGYGVFQLLMLLRLAPWITRQPFAASYWAFSFGITALSTGALHMVWRGTTGAIAVLALPAFVLANVAMIALLLGSLWRLSQGRFLPPAPVMPAPGP